MTLTHTLQWSILTIGAIAHGFSKLIDEDTVADRPMNWQLDRKDGDGDLSDGMQDGWFRFWKVPGRWLHDAKNIYREWLEIVHPKTAARVSGRIMACLVALWTLTLAFAVVGWAI